ncbi:MAG: hypothetical protein WB808_03365 [Candidatus Dormiibacterota bacterium]
MHHRVLVTKKRLGAFIAVAAVLGSTAGVLAYMVAVGTGATTAPSGTAVATAAPVNLTVSVASSGSVTKAGGGSDAAWNFTDTQTFALSVSNPSSSESVTLHKVTLASWQSDSPNCNSSVNSGALAGTYTMPDVAWNTSFSPGSGGDTPNLVVTFNNLPSTDQSVCQGATPSFVFNVS